MVPVLLFFLLFALTVEAQSGYNNTTSTMEDEECEDYDINWFIQKYNHRILTKPFLHIGVNISLAGAASTRHWEFKKLLRNARYHRLTKHQVCNEHIPQHSQQFDQACGWTYKCDYNPHRFPSYIFQAECKDRTWRPAHSPTPHSCYPIYYPIPVLYSSGCNPLTSKKDWYWTLETVTVSCA